MSAGALPEAERAARLRLARSEGVGPVSHGQLLKRFGSAVAAIEALIGMGKPVADPDLVAREVELAAAVGARHLLLGEPDYPPLLAELADPPPVLVATGDAALAARPVVAMVGARNASAAGRGLALEMAEALGAAGWVVASGLARGIDAEAHRGSLPTGTIGCVAGGVDIAYPPENAELQQQVAARGLLLSEMPPGTEPQARHFPRRNRLIAGVARGVVVIEAAPGSGSLITARIAGEAGREVMAVPGHPRDPRSGGGNGLIRQGATLVEQAADVLAVLSPFPVVARKELPARPGRTICSTCCPSAAWRSTRWCAPRDCRWRPSRRCSRTSRSRGGSSGWRAARWRGWHLPRLRSRPPAVYAPRPREGQAWIW